MIDAPWYVQQLVCPDCFSEIDYRDKYVRCVCGFSKEIISGAIDLRPTKSAVRQLKLPVNSSAPADLQDCLIERPKNSYVGPSAIRDSRELFSALSEVGPLGTTFLDLGCGPRDQAVPASHLGFKYVGVDYSSDQADIKCDAHAIPFRNETFDVVFSYAVLEHMYNPFLAVSEVARVLKIGGWYVGTVSQGEPFHGSYYHHTAWGLLNTLMVGGLKAVRLWGSYDTLAALSEMGRYPKVGRPLIKMLDLLLAKNSILAPRKWLSWSSREREIDRLHRAGSICFLARR